MRNLLRKTAQKLPTSSHPECSRDKQRSENEKYNTFILPQFSATSEQVTTTI